MRHLGLLATPCLLLWIPAGAFGQSVPGLRVPPGFEITEYADSKLANDIFCMTLDPRGRVVVSGRGYIRILVDDDHDGRADRAIPFSDSPKDGAQGLLWEGDTLFITGDGGLGCFQVARDGDQPTGPSRLIRAMKTGGEHAAHALRRGPDGWLYVLCGNNAGIDQSFGKAPTSPIQDPVAGGVLRFSPKFETCEIVADGFRNPYGMDFNADGELFTYDSDNERCVSLPWYEPTRLYHVIAGGHYGWQSPQHGEFWRQPPYFCDVVAPVGTFGRGSPTGVACYRHTQFPEHFRGGLFLLDWTFGRIYFVRLQRAGSSYTCRKEVFLQAEGDNGFAPTAIVVHPETGDLFVSIGGRGTRGAVYRIRYPKGFATLPKTKPAKAKPLIEVAACNTWNNPDRYIRYAAARRFARLELSARRQAAKEAKTPREQTTIALALCQDDPAATLTLAGGLLSADTPLESRLAAVRLVQLALGDLTAPRSRGTVWEGYSPRRALHAGGVRYDDVLAGLRKAFPAGHADLDRELSRTFAMLEDADAATLDKVAAILKNLADPVEEIHYLIVLARLRGPRSGEITATTAASLLGLDLKITEKHLNRDTNWPLRIAELYKELARKDPQLNGALLAHSEFGRSDHVLFTRAAGFDRPRAARVFLQKASKQQDYPWNAALVRLIGDLPEGESLPGLRALWGKAGLDSVVLPFLARHPRADDRGMFLQGISSPQLRDVQICLEALEQLPLEKSGAEVLAVLRSLQGLPEGSEGDALRRRLHVYLERITGQHQPAGDRQGWVTWFCKTYPDLSPRLTNPDGVDVVAWEKRLAGVEWSQGDPARGQSVFARCNCASCHGSAQALGPDLNGVANRFSRADLFTAILQPSRDVSPRYQTTLIETTAGKVYQGLIIYEAVDGVILQTGPATTVRVSGSDIASRRVTRISLMPPGLLDGVADRDLADLYAYLRSLGSPTKK
jgi:putative membrane-bound dehydrogenase-like protein